jgi:hypothetical protein
MSKLIKPPPVQLFIAFIYIESSELKTCIKNLENNLGPLSLKSKILEFKHSGYYKKEMGENLKRKVIGFQNLIERDKLVEIKIFTNSLEEQFSFEERRTINIDPGYISGEHLILATGKGFYHRPYLGKGVYADLTLVYQQKSFRALEWTYPDYNSDNMLGVFYKLREIYTEKLKEGNY